jgi:Flp pilus assembly protein TadD
MSTSARIEELTRKFEENPRRYFAPLANEYRKAGDVEQAIAICRAHLPQQPGHMSGHIVYGQALYEAGALDEARSVFETALQLDPENLIALRHLGDISLRLGDRHAAREWYTRVLDADPRNDEMLALLHSLDAPATPVAVEAVAEPESTWAAPAGEQAEAELPAELPPAVLDGTVAMDEVAAAAGGDDDLGLELPTEWSAGGAVPSAEGFETTSFGEASTAELPALEAELEPTTGYVAEGEPARPLELDGFESTTLTGMIGADEERAAPAATSEEPGWGEMPAEEAPAEFPVSWPTASEEGTSAEVAEVEERYEEAYILDAPTEAGEPIRLVDETREGEGMGESPAAPALDGAVAALSQTPAWAPVLPDLSAPTFDDEPADSAPLQVGTADGEVPLPGDEPPAFGAVELPPPSPAFDEVVAGAEEPGAGAQPVAFATETMADLLLSQGHRAQAIDVLRQLAAERPDDDRLRDRLAALQVEEGPTARGFFAALAGRRPGAAAPAVEPLPDLATDAAWDTGVREDAWPSETAAEAEATLPALDSTEPLAGAPAEETISEPTAPSEPAIEEPRRERSITPFALDESYVPVEALPALPEPSPLDAATASAPLVEPAVETPEPVDVGEADTTDGVPTRTSGSLDALFGGAARSAEDDAAARALSDAFAPADTATPIAGRPAIRAQDQLSLDRVFRGEGSEPARPSGSFSFEQFFGGAGTAPAARPTPAAGSQTPPLSRPASGAGDADDIEQFNSWLQGLKKR